MNPEKTHTKENANLFVPEFMRKISARCTRTGAAVLLGVALLAVVLAVYMQAGNFPFINFDDNVYVTENPHVVSGLTVKSIEWAFISTDKANWHPLTWLSHMADVQIYGLNPRGHHLTNVVIHAVSALVLFFLLLRLTGGLWQSFFVAALFALHPLRVETVAWVAERKDVLSAFFWFLTLLLYAGYVEKQGRSRYLLALLSFVLGLMSKPMLVTLPVVMLLIDFWPLGRYRHPERDGLKSLLNAITILTREKIPFFAFSLISGLITIYAQHKGGAIMNLVAIPFELRIENALVAYVKYIGKTIWPDDLALFYPFPPSIPLWQVIGSLFILLLLSGAAIRAGQRYAYLVVGWFWFLITLVPVIGIIQVGTQSMADRYLYIPAIGLFIIAAWGIPDLARGLRHRQGILSLLAAAVIITSTVLTWHQLGYWRDGISLYRHTLQVTTGNSVIHHNLGYLLNIKGDLDGAIREYNLALRIIPNDMETHVNLGLVLFNKGDFNEAILETRKALLIKPDSVQAHYNLGVIYQAKGELDAAIKEFQETLLISPDYMDARNYLEIAVRTKGYRVAAMQEYMDTLRVNHNDINAHKKLGLVFANNGDLDAAMQQFREVLRIDFNDADAHNNLGNALATKGNLDDAIQEYRQALRIKPDALDVHINLGLVMAKKGDLDAAIRQFQEALRISPNDFNALRNLKRAIAQKRMHDEIGN